MLMYANVRLIWTPIILKRLLVSIYTGLLRVMKEKKYSNQSKSLWGVSVQLPMYKNLKPCVVCDVEKHGDKAGYLGESQMGLNSCEQGTKFLPLPPSNINILIAWLLLPEECLRERSQFSVKCKQRKWVEMFESYFPLFHCFLYVLPCFTSFFIVAWNFNCTVINLKA